MLKRKYNIYRFHFFNSFISINIVW